MAKEKLYKVLPLNYLKSIGRVPQSKATEEMINILNKEKIYSKMIIINNYSTQTKNRKKKLRVVDLAAKIGLKEALESPISIALWCIPKNWLAEIK